MAITFTADQMITLQCRMLLFHKIPPAELSVTKLADICFKTWHCFCVYWHRRHCFSVRLTVLLACVSLLPLTIQQRRGVTVINVQKLHFNHVLMATCIDLHIENIKNDRKVAISHHHID